MTETQNQWKKNPKLISIIDKYERIEKGDWESIKRVSGEFIHEAIKLGMPPEAANCCGFNLVEGGTICPQCRALLDNA